MTSQHESLDLISKRVEKTEIVTSGTGENDVTSSGLWTCSHCPVALKTHEDYVAHVSTHTAPNSAPKNDIPTSDTRVGSPIDVARNTDGEDAGNAPVGVLSDSQLQMATSTISTHPTHQPTCKTNSTITTTATRTATHNKLSIVSPPPPPSTTTDETNKYLNPMRIDTGDVCKAAANSRLIQQSLTTTDLFEKHSSSARNDNTKYLTRLINSTDTGAAPVISLANFPGGHQNPPLLFAGRGNVNASKVDAVALNPSTVVLSAFLNGVSVYTPTLTETTNTSSVLRDFEDGNKMKSPTSVVVKTTEDGVSAFCNERIYSFYWSLKSLCFRLDSSRPD